MYLLLYILLQYFVIYIACVFCPVRLDIGVVISLFYNTTCCVVNYIEIRLAFLNCNIIIRICIIFVLNIIRLCGVLVQHRSVLGWRICLTIARL